MPLPVAPTFPLPGPYGTQVTDAKAFILIGTAPPLAVAVAGGTWVPVGYPGDITLFNHDAAYAGVNLTTALNIEATNDPAKTVIHNLGTMAVGTDTFRMSDVGYRWLRAIGTVTAASVLTLEPEHLLTPGTTTATGPRSAKEGDEQAALPEGDQWSKEELESLNKAELEDILAEQGKPTSGSKAELVDRVLA
jgi:SAP domain